MSEADGALISHLDDLQARLSRVAALSAPVDVAVASASPTPARALKSRAAHSPRPTPVPRSLPPSPALEGRAAYYQTRDVVPRRAKRRHQLGGSETARGPPSPFATHHETTLGGSALFHAPPERASWGRIASPRGVRSEAPLRARENTREEHEREQRERERETVSDAVAGQKLASVRAASNENEFENASTSARYVAELDATRARLVDAESRFLAKCRDAEVLAERLRLAGEAEAKCAARVTAIVEDAERVAREATRRLAPAPPPPEPNEDEKRKADGTFASRAAAACIAAAEARGEAVRLVSALGADPELANGLVRKLGEVSWLVADLAAAAEE